MHCIVIFFSLQRIKKTYTRAMGIKVCLGWTVVTGGGRILWNHGDLSECC